MPTNQNKGRYVAENRDSTIIFQSDTRALPYSLLPWIKIISANISFERYNPRSDGFISSGIIHYDEKHTEQSYAKSRLKSDAHSGVFRNRGELLRLINVRWCLSATDAAFGQP